MRLLVGFQHVLHCRDEGRVGVGGITHCRLRCKLESVFLSLFDRVVARLFHDVQFDDLLFEQP